MAEGHVATGKNFLLGKLVGEEPERAIPELELVMLEIKHQLYEPDVPISHVYFPVDGVMSMLAQLDEGLLVEVATVGNEGMIGLPLFLGTDVTPGVAYSQVPGQAYKLPAEEFMRLLDEEPSLTAVLHRYTQALMVQISQGTACNRVHSNQQRCARWLLLSHDRVGRDEFKLTQEFLAQMLGVRRATVNEVAGRLQQQGMIEYSRGVIRVLDRPRLEAASCRCYRIIRDEYDRMYADLTEGEPEAMAR